MIQRAEFKNQKIGIQHEGNTAAIDYYSVKTMRFEWEDNKELQKREGEWIDESNYPQDDHYYRCSKCGKKADYFVCGSEDWWCVKAPNYCPNCGARMKGEE